MYVSLWPAPGMTKSVFGAGDELVETPALLGRHDLVALGHEKELGRGDRPDLGSRCRNGCG